jgi:hypothetical protein
MAGGNSDPDASDGIPSEARSGVRGEIQTFLTTRRARISPEQAGLPAYGGERRRVAGLRRDEVALLAGTWASVGLLPDCVVDARHVAKRVDPIAAEWLREQLT